MHPAGPFKVDLHPIPPPQPSLHNPSERCRYPHRETFHSSKRWERKKERKTTPLGTAYVSKLTLADEMHATSVTHSPPTFLTLFFAQFLYCVWDKCAPQVKCLHFEACILTRIRHGVWNTSDCCLFLHRPSAYILNFFYSPICSFVPEELHPSRQGRGKSRGLQTKQGAERPNNRRSNALCAFYLSTGSNTEWRDGPFQNHGPGFRSPRSSTL